MKKHRPDAAERIAIEAFTPGNNKKVGPANRLVLEHRLPVYNGHGWGLQFFTDFLRDRLRREIRRAIRADRKARAAKPKPTKPKLVVVRDAKGKVVPMGTTWGRDTPGGYWKVDGLWKVGIGWYDGNERMADSVSDASELDIGWPRQPPTKPKGGRK